MEYSKTQFKIGNAGTRRVNDRYCPMVGGAVDFTRRFQHMADALLAAKDDKESNNFSNYE